MITTVIMLLLLPLMSFVCSNPQRIIRVLGCSETKKIFDVKAQVDFYLDRLKINEDIIILVTFVDFKHQNERYDINLLGTTVSSTFEGRPMMHVLIEENVIYRKQMLILAHEMIHVKQFVRGELIEHNDKHFTWKGKDYYCVEDIAYQNRGWESEALNLQTRLLTSFKEFRKNQENFLSQK